MKQKLLMSGSVCLLLLTSFVSGLEGKQSRKGSQLVFEGTVIRIGKAPRFLCGTVAPYRLAEYRVERVYVGKYDKREIVVDHLFCSVEVLSDLKPGDKVLIVVDTQKKMLERSNDGEIRKDGDRVDSFYVARRVARSTSCCDF
ncbi:MAG: hypothetical protein ACREA9_04995 [Pyrinomonadaceae bacterium]